MLPTDIICIYIILLSNLCCDTLLTQELHLRHNVLSLCLSERNSNRNCLIGFVSHAQYSMTQVCVLHSEINKAEWEQKNLDKAIG